MSIRASVRTTLLALTVLGTVAVGGPSTAASTSSTASAAVPLGPCVASDHGNPLLDSLTLSRDHVNVRSRGRTLVMRADVRDTGGPGPAVGVSEVFGSLSDPAGRIRTHRLHAVGDSTWSGTFRVPRHSPPGRWTVQLSASDSVGNSAHWDAASLKRAGQQNGFRVISRVDRRAPVLTRFTLSPSRINALSDRRRVTLTVAARDAGSGVDSLTASLDQRAGALFGTTNLLDLHRVSGTARDGRWRAHVEIPAWAPGGRWDPELSVTDNAGRSRTYTRESPAGTPKAATVLPLKPLRVRSSADHDRPVVDTLTVSPGAVDVRAAAQSVTFEVHAHDATSGLAAPSISIESNHLQRVFPLRLVAGTLTSGTWRGVLNLTPCDAIAGTWTVLVDAQDRTQNNAAGRGPESSLLVQANDHLPPTYSSVGASTTQVPLVFDEDVAGITGDSASLRHFPGGLRDPRNTAVSGHWDCRTVNSLPIDCDAGPVRTATFLPDATLVAGTYAAAFNPEHVLQVTDFAGNPASSVVFPNISITSP